MPSLATEEVGDKELSQQKQQIEQMLKTESDEPDSKDENLDDSDSKDTSNKVRLLKDRYEVHLDKPMPDMDKGSSKAYYVVDRTNSNIKLFGLVCDHKKSIRYDAISAVKTINSKYLMNLVEYGVINNVLVNNKTIVLIYQLPEAGRVVSDINKSFTPITDHEKLKKVVYGLLTIIDELKFLSITCRNIRLDNLYYADSAKEEIMIGDIISSPAASLQPPVYETIESLVVDSNCRGSGSYENDLYSVGAVISALIMGEEPLKGKKNAEVLALKIKYGSYNSILNGTPVHNKINDILRGLLVDDKSMRWDSGLIYSFLEGKKLTPAPTKISVRDVKRPYKFDGIEYSDVRELAIAIAKNPDEIYKEIVQGNFLTWVRKSIGDEKLSEKVEYIQEKFIPREASSPNVKFHVALRIAIFLWKDIPLIYKTISMYPNALADVIFEKINDGQSVDLYEEMILSDVIKIWYAEAGDVWVPGAIHKLRAYVVKKEVGYGMERVMYEMNKLLPCISPLLRGENVIVPTKLLPALENKYEAIDNSKLPMDKYIGAYLFARFGNKIEKDMAEMNSYQDAPRTSAVLKIYAVLQTRFGPKSLPNLCHWMLGHCSSIIETYNNSKHRVYLEKQLPKVAKKGSLSAIYNLLEDVEARNSDKSGFMEAKREVRELVREKRLLTNNDQYVEKEATDMGQQISSLIGVFVAVLSLFANLIYLLLELY